MRLTARGKEQAKGVGKHLQEVAFDHAYSSSLERGYESLMLILRENEKKVRTFVTYKLNERNYGVLQGMQRKDAVVKWGKSEYMRWRKGYYEAPPEGESVAEMEKRVLAFYDEEILPRLRSGGSVLVVAHSGSIRAIMQRIEGLTKTQTEKLEIENAVPIVYELESGLESASKTIGYDYPTRIHVSLCSS